MPRPAWKFAFVSALATLSADVSIAARPAPVKDFSRQVEVVVGGRLRETAQGQAELSVSLWNKTDTAVAGPIFLVIDDTGVEQVQVGSHEEETAQGKPVFVLVPADQELLPGGMTSAFPLAFEIPEGLSRDDANRVKLSTRVFGRTGSPDARKLEQERQARADADFATRGKSYSQADLNAAIRLQEQVTPELLKKPDVLATGIVENAKGQLALQVYTELRSTAKQLPGTVGNLEVQVKPVPGGFKSGPSRSSVTLQNGVAMSKASRDKAAAEAKSGNNPNLVTAVDPAQRFDRPVPIGVSSFNAQTDDGGGGILCASGTLGVRAKDAGGKLYAISNSHVWGALGLASVGQLIVQPSQGDNNCLTEVDTNTIGTLVDFTDYTNSLNGPYFRPGITMNFIDAALMEVGEALDAEGNTVPAVGFATPSDGYGAPSSKILRQNRLGLQVQKYGRTTGYTRGYTSAMNVMATIGGATPAEATDFYRLDEYTGFGEYASLGAPGDSGSLIVTLEDRRPVSLLFAGGAVNLQQKTLTLGNQIGPVLDWFNVKIDDGADPNVQIGGPTAAGMTGRGGIAMGNVSKQDLIDFAGVDATTGGITGLLPADLVGRVKPNRKRLNPVTSGTSL